MRDGTLLQSARDGDESAFVALVEPLRSQLDAHCRRLLRSPHDAEDALQETLLRAWRGMPEFEGRSSLRSWLYRIATNVCISMIERRERRPAVHRVAGSGGVPNGADESWHEFGPSEHPADELSAIEDPSNSPEDRYDRREGLELALLAALLHLTPKQRAALILSEALGFTGKETAALLGTTTASISSALQRARRIIDERLPERRHQPSLWALGDERLREVVEGYAKAMEEADIPAVVSAVRCEEEPGQARRSSPPFAAARGRTPVAAT